MKYYLLPSISTILFATIHLPFTPVTAVPPQSLALPPTLNSTTGPPRCAFNDLNPWSAGLVKYADCLAAIARFQSVYNMHGKRKFEFSNRHRDPQTTLPHESTPSCFDVRGCSACIAMIADFSPVMRNAIPRLPPPPAWVGNDVADAFMLWNAAKMVGDTCLRDAGTYGWAPVGATGGIGVFLWAKGSLLEKDAYRVEGVGGADGNGTVGGGGTGVETS